MAFNLLFWVTVLGCLWKIQQQLLRKYFLEALGYPQTTCPLKHITAQSRSKRSVRGSLLEHLNSGGTLTVGNGYIQEAAPSPLSQAAGLVSGRGDQ